MTAHGSSGGISRRRFLRGAGVATVAASGVLAGPARASLPLIGTPRKQTVAVFGGGIAGLTAAHELIERGFDVTVYERRAWGGKARSTEVPGSAAGGRRPLPGEHSFRVFFGFYQNLPDTMRRIPFGSSANGVFDNLVPSPNAGITRPGRRALVLPLGAVDPLAYTPTQIRETILGLALQLELPPQAAAFFADRLVVFFSSCDARRLGQWENTPWSEFIQADHFGGDYRRILSEGFGHLTWASEANRTSTKLVGNTFEWFVYNLLGLNSNGPPFRIFNAPTTEAFVDPWTALLGRLGVGLKLGHTVEGFDVRDGRIVGARVRGPSGLQSVVADWYVCALPVPQARQLWSQPILAADPQLARMANLGTQMAAGIKFFLRKRTPLVKGIVAYLDAPWFLASNSQAQFWPRDFASTYGDGTVQESLSVVIVDWTKPGIIYGKPARDLEPAQVAREVWEQMKQQLNGSGLDQLTDDMLVSWNLDPGVIARKGGGLESEDLVTLGLVGSFPNRPGAGTAIPNLILAGDYVVGDWEMANMEVANETGRRAANAILERAGSRESAVRVISPYRPPEWEPLKLIDDVRYRAGLPNQFDTPLLRLLTTPLLGAL